MFERTLRLDTACFDFLFFLPTKSYTTCNLSKITGIKDSLYMMVYSVIRLDNEFLSFVLYFTVQWMDSFFFSGLLVGM